MQKNTLGKAFAVVVVLFGMSACAVEATTTTPSVECRTVEVRNRRDVETCHARCGDNGCHEHCAERERWAREHRCWVE